MRPRSATNRDLFPGVFFSSAMMDLLSAEVEKSQRQSREKGSGPDSAPLENSAWAGLFGLCFPSSVSGRGAAQDMGVFGPERKRETLADLDLRASPRPEIKWVRRVSPSQSRLTVVSRPSEACAIYSAFSKRFPLSTADVEFEVLGAKADVHGTGLVLNGGENGSVIFKVSQALRIESSLDQVGHPHQSGCVEIDWGDSRPRFADRFGIDAHAEGPPVGPRPVLRAAGRG